LHQTLSGSINYVKASAPQLADDDGNLKQILLWIVLNYTH